MANVLALSREQVSKLTGLSRRQLSYWDRTGFFAPTFGYAQGSGPYSRVYSFKDVVGLRTLARMRRDHEIPLQHLRAVGRVLLERYSEPWSELAFYIVGRQVFFRASEASAAANASGQSVFEFALERVAEEIQAEIDELSRRKEEDFGKVVKIRQVAESRPVIAGTRTPTSALWSFHEAGFSIAEIVGEYPDLTERDVAAAIAYEQELRRKSA